MRKLQNATATRRHLPSLMRYCGACAPDEPLGVTLVLRRRQPMERPIPRIPRAEFAARYGADPADVERVRAFGKQHGMQELACDMARRSLRWQGDAKSLPKDRIASLDAAQDEVNDILSRRDANRMICEHSRTIGSNLKSQQCVSYGQRERARLKAQDNLTTIRQQPRLPPKGGTFRD